MSTLEAILNHNLRSVHYLKERIPLHETNEDYRAIPFSAEQDLEQRINDVRKQLDKVLNGSTPRNKINWEKDVYPIVRVAFDYKLHPSQSYLRRLVFKQLIQDSKSGNFAKTREVQDNYSTNFLIRFFPTKIPNVAENAKRKFNWNLEFMTYDPVPIDSDVRDRFPSKARAVELRRCSEGFKDPRRVAIFSEEFLTSEEEKNDPNSFSYYIIDRFDKRHILKTRAIIENCIKGNIFNELLNIDGLVRRLATSAWLSGHESFHSTDDELPRVPRSNKPLIEKQFAYGITGGGGILELAAFEEARVDLNALQTLYDTKSISIFGGDKRKIAWQFIFAERLLRYPADYGPKDFDSIVSFVLLNHLQLKGLIEVTNHHIEFKESQAKIQEALSSLLAEMNKLKTEIYEEAKSGGFSKTNLESAKQKIVAFIRNKAGACFDTNKGIYVNPPFYENAKKLFIPSSYSRSDWFKVHMLRQAPPLRQAG